MFEDLNNKEYASKLDEKVKFAEVRCPSLNTKGDIVEAIMAMGFSWQKSGTKYTGKTRKERAKHCIGTQSKAVNDSWHYTRAYCIMCKKQVTHKWKVHQHIDLLQEESQLDQDHQIRTAHSSH
eukprot:1263262-Heterocapsa_arctica.AAC.1